MGASGKASSCSSFPPATGMQAGHRASRSNRILINRTHPKAVTMTVVLAPKQHRKPGCGRRRAQSGSGGDMSKGLEGTGWSVCRESIVL